MCSPLKCPREILVLRTIASFHYVCTSLCSCHLLQQLSLSLPFPRTLLGSTTGTSAALFSLTQSALATRRSSGLPPRRWGCPARRLRPHIAAPLHSTPLRSSQGPAGLLRAALPFAPASGCAGRSAACLARGVRGLCAGLALPVAIAAGASGR